MADWQRRLPPLATLLPFEAAARHRNFTRAARELHYSQATISRRIGELEADLGTSLFERGRHDVTPTPEAESLAAAVRLAFGELGSAADTIRRQAFDRDRLTIFTDLSLATTLIAPMIGEFQRGRPGLEIRVLSSFEPVTTTNEDFDVAVEYDRNETTSYAVEPIADDQVFPVCAPELAAQLPPGPTAADLLGLPLLHVDYAEPAWTDWRRFLTYLDADVPEALEGLTFTSYVVCLDVAERGEGIALGWQRTVQPLIDSGRLVRVPGLVMPQPNVINAYRPRAEATNPVVDEFVATLKVLCNPGSGG